MSSSGSVTAWIDRLCAGDRDATKPLLQGYFQPLVDLARKKLRNAPRGMADEEDVPLSAFDSFIRGAAKGRFPQLTDRDDLRHLLLVITERKAVDLVNHERREKRGGGCPAVRAPTSPKIETNASSSLSARLLFACTLKFGP